MISLALVSCVSPSAQSYSPKGGFVPNAATAIKIAEAVWAPIYGEKQLRSERPFHADLRGNVWRVYGSFPPARPGWEYVGGTVEAEIDRRSGKVLRVTHGE